MCLTYRALRTFTAGVGFSAALLLSGCGNSDSPSSSDNTTPKTPATPVAGTLDTKSENFIKDAANANMAEVQLGQLAQTQSTDASVKQFGQHMIDDHSKNLEQVKQLATKKNVTLPSDPNADAQDQKSQLAKLNGADFDHAYVKLMFDDHQKDVAEFERASNTLTDSDVKSYAEQTLPTLRDHLKMARDLNNRINASNGQAMEKPVEQPVQIKEPDTKQTR